MKKKAIVFLINSLSNGGAERVVVNMANHYAKDYKVYIITLFDAKTYTIDSKIEIIPLYSSQLSRYKKIVKLPSTVKKIEKIVEKIEKDYTIELLTSHLIYSNLLSRLSKYRKNMINVIHVSYQVYDRKLHYVFKKLLQFLYNNTPIVTVSRGCQKELIDKYKIKPSHIETIYNPLNRKEMNKLKKEKCDIHDPYILFTGRLDTPKRPDLLIDIFYQGKFYIDYKLCIVGVGPYEKKIKEKINKYHIEDRVILKGWQQNVFKYMKNAKLFVNCSRNEAFPMTMIEALCCDCPVVSFDIDYGPNEILIDKFSAFLAEDGNISSMIEVMKRALTNYPDLKELNLAQFNVEKVNQKYLDLSRKWK